MFHSGLDDVIFELFLSISQAWVVGRGLATTTVNQSLIKVNQSFIHILKVSFSTFPLELVTTSINELPGIDKKIYHGFKGLL